MTSASPSTVVPLGYSLKAAARRLGCSQQMVLEFIAEDEVPAVMVDGEPRVPRGFFTGYAWFGAPRLV